MSIPVCPKCGEAHTLKLADDEKIRCFKVYGGCGAVFTLDEFPFSVFYRVPVWPGPGDDSGKPAKPTPRKRRKS